MSMQEACRKIQDPTKRLFFDSYNSCDRGNDITTKWVQKSECSCNDLPDIALRMGSTCKKEKQSRIFELDAMIPRYNPPVTGCP